MKVLLLLLFFFTISAATNNYQVGKEEIQNFKTKRYFPKWYSLDSRPLPEWYDQAKIGIFLHWGVYSVPGFESEWFWKKLKDGNKLFTQFMRKNYPLDFSYEEFAPMFKAEFFDPDKWASLFLKAGAKYVVLTSKHHDGYTLFPSKRSFSWNSMEVGPKRDLVQDLAKSVRRISKMKVLLLLLFFFTISAATNNYQVGKEEIQNFKTKRYFPKWYSLDSRPLPEWYDQAKIGIFLHWGVYSVPGFESEWFWKKLKDGNKLFTQFMRKNYPLDFSYEEFAPMFKAEFFDPDKWASLFLKAGAKYVVLTSKHHDGYTLFPSKRSFSWNSMEVGPKRDLVQDLAKSVRSKNLKFGVYHSLYEWYNPMYKEDKINLYTTRNYVNAKLWPDLKQIVNDYKPSVIWSDGDWEALDTYWNSTDFLAWLYNDSPVKDTVVVNDRWGTGIPCHHGDFYNCADRYNPGKLQKHKWENAFNVDSKSWGYRRNMAIDEILTINQLLKEVVSTVSCGGNVLINVGPTKEGTIAPVFQERLLALGEWLSTNGEAIYETSPWHYQNDTKNAYVWYTCVKQVYNALKPTSPPRKSDVITAIYAMFLKWPSKNQLVMHDIVPQLHSGIYKVKMLGSEQYLTWEIDSGLAFITLPDQATVQSKNAWTLKFTPDN